jgi:lipoic acid synthetase
MSSTPRTIPLAVVAEGSASLEPGARQVADQKIGRSPVEFAEAPVLRKPSWIRVRIPSGNAVQALKSKLRENRLVTVCEDASCPNIHECFSHGTATFMILGDVCTRRCSSAMSPTAGPSRRRRRAAAAWRRPSPTWA